MQFNNPFGDNYPFIGPPMDDPSVEKCVYDIYITYYEPTLDYKLPLSLTSIRRRGRTNVVIKDAEGATVFSGACTSREWGNDFIVMEGSNNDVSVALVIKSGITAYTPDHGELCLRCVYTQPKHVTSITVNNTKLSPNIFLDEGYNTNYSITNDNGIRITNLVTINAIPGAGLGQTPVDCNEPKPRVVTSINGIEPDSNGSIFLNGKDATKASQDGVNSITVGDDTTPCCYCEDFTYLAKVLDKHITNHYVLGATAEAARETIKEIVELLECSDIDIILCKDFKPIRVYIDTSWPRFAIITVEVRNIFPALMTGLHVTATTDIEMQDFTPLRTYKPTELVPRKAPLDSQDTRHGNLVHKSGSNSFYVDWSEYTLDPGMTVWSTVRVRNGSACLAGSEPITVTATASFMLRRTGCIKEECLENIEIIYTDTASASIKGGYGWNDPSGKEDDIPSSGSDGALQCMLDRVYEICEEEANFRASEGGTSA